MTPDLPLWANLILAAAAVMVGLATLWRYVFPALRGLWRLAHGTAKLVEDFRETGGFGGLARQIAPLTADMAEVKRELYPNGGSSLRDSVTRTERHLTGIAEQTGRLEGYAAENRAGIADLRDQAEQQSQRVTEHRRRNDDTIAALREYLTQRLNAMEVSHAQFDAMRASLHELGIDVQPPEPPHA